QRLYKQSEQRAAELAIINSVQNSLAAELSMQGIYDAVGDKIREIFHDRDLSIRIYDPQTDTVRFPYSYEKGVRLHLPPGQLGGRGFFGHIIRTGETLVVNEDMEGAARKYGSSTVPGSSNVKASVFVPMVVGDQV